MSIEITYVNDGVTISDNGQFITGGKTAQHFVTAKNTIEQNTHLYDVTETVKDKRRVVTLNEKSTETNWSGKNYY